MTGGFSREFALIRGKKNVTDIAIRVENLSKQYPSTKLRTSRIGGPQAPYKTIRESLTEAMQATFRRVGKLLRGQTTGIAELDETIDLQ